MKREVVTMDEYGKVVVPSDTANIWMNEMELGQLFGVIAPTLRAAVRAVYKSGVLKEYEVLKYVRLENGYYAEVFGFPMVVVLAFRINSFGADLVRKAILERLYLRKEKQNIFFVLDINSMIISNYQA